VFPLLCPVREKDWLYDWEYEMICSESGLIEKGCVFTTAHHGKHATVWYVTEYDKDNFSIEFLRLTPKSEVVKINIKLKETENYHTETKITYEYTPLNKERSDYLKLNIDKDFENMMLFWEKAVNHYLETGKMLKI